MNIKVRIRQEIEIAEYKITTGHFNNYDLRDDIAMMKANLKRLETD